MVEAECCKRLGHSFDLYVHRERVLLSKGVVHSKSPLEGVDR